MNWLTGFLRRPPIGLWDIAEILVVWGLLVESIEEIVVAAANLSSQRIGAIIAIERQIGLRNYIEGGIRLDAVLTYDLLQSIFLPSSPLHDGAVIVQIG